MTTITKSRNKSGNHRWLDRSKQHRVCIQGLIHLASVIGGGGMVQDIGVSCLNDFLNYLCRCDDPNESVQPLIPPNRSQYNGFVTQDFLKSVGEYWTGEGYLGFVAVVQAPVTGPEHLDDDFMPDNDWIYADTYPQVFDLTIKWAEEMAMKRKFRGLK